MTAWERSGGLAVGQTFQFRPTGLEQVGHGSFSRDRQAGQRMKSLDRGAALVAGAVFEVPQPHLGPLMSVSRSRDVLEELRRTKDRVDERADEGEERSGSGAADQEGVGDPATGVGEGEDDEGDPDRDQHQDGQSDGQVQRGISNSEDGDSMTRGTSFRIGTQCRRRRE